MANTQANGKLYICATEQPSDLNQTEYEALTWVKIKGVGNIGEIGTSVNIVSYDTWDTTVTQKAKGIADAGSPDIELARIYDDAGQILLNTAAGTNYNYAFKFEYADAPTANHSNTIVYNRGLVSGPKRPGGRNEDFILEVFTLALNQEEIVVDPTT